MIVRALFDTNVLVSGFASPGGTPARLLERWSRGEFVLLVSDVVIVELRRTLRNDYFSRLFTPEMVEANIDLLAREAEWVTVTTEVSGVASHVEDDLILATALSAGADALVTGDRALLDLGSFTDTRILTPAEFLELIIAADEQ